MEREHTDHLRAVREMTPEQLAAVLVQVTRSDRRPMTAEQAQKMAEKMKGEPKTAPPTRLSHLGGVGRATEQKLLGNFDAELWFMELAELEAEKEREFQRKVGQVKDLIASWEGSIVGRNLHATFTAHEAIRGWRDENETYPRLGEVEGAVAEYYMRCAQAQTALEVEKEKEKEEKSARHLLLLEEQAKKKKEREERAKKKREERERKEEERRAKSAERKGAALRRAEFCQENQTMMEVVRVITSSPPSEGAKRLVLDRKFSSHPGGVAFLDKCLDGKGGWSRAFDHQIATIYGWKTRDVAFARSIVVREGGGTPPVTSRIEGLGDFKISRKVKRKASPKKPRAVPRTPRKREGPTPRPGTPRPLQDLFRVLQAGIDQLM